MTSSADISVVITTYNRAEFLVEAIRSVLNQTCAPREIIIVDDGSTSETRSALSVFGSKVVYIQQENAGQQTARNRGVQKAQGAWVTTLDDDDLYRPNYVAEVSAAIRGSPANVVYTDHRKFFGKRPRERTNFEEAPPDIWFGIERKASGWSHIGQYPVKHLLKWIAFYPSTMAMTKVFYQSIGGYNPQFRGIKSEDIEFLARALTTGNLSIAWSPLVDYRLHEGNATSSVYLTILGRLRIFEAMRKDPSVSPELQAALDTDLPARRAWGLDFAFKVGDFDLVRSLGSQFRLEDWTPSRKVRYKIAGLPAPANVMTADFCKRIIAISKRSRHLLDGE